MTSVPKLNETMNLSEERVQRRLIHRQDELKSESHGLVVIGPSRELFHGEIEVGRPTLGEGSKLLHRLTDEARRKLERLLEFHRHASGAQTPLLNPSLPTPDAILWAWRLSARNASSTQARRERTTTPDLAELVGERMRTVVGEVEVSLKRAPATRLGPARRADRYI
jgi:hypothetical protein